ncbi:MAG: OmpH family outer membrane protein [Candidatus Sulfotelmatobacter sp.]
MTSKFLRSVLAIAVFSMISAWAQTGGAATPSAPSAASAAPASPAPSPSTTGTKVGTINVEAAVFGSNEGRRDADALTKKLEPKQNELKAQNEELEGLQKQLQTQGDKLNEDAKATLVKQIETKKKSLDRSVQDFQEDGQAQGKEIFGRILNKMAPTIVKYAKDNGFQLIVDTSNQWPQSQVLWSGEGVDITKEIVDAYNVQSGVPAPAAAAKAPAPKPASTTPKPTAPAPTAPPK